MTLGAATVDVQAVLVAGLRAHLCRRIASSCATALTFTHTAQPLLWPGIRQVNCCLLPLKRHMQAWA